MPPTFSLDVPAAINRLMRFLSIEGITGQEAAIGKEIVKALKEVGVPRPPSASTIRTPAFPSRRRPATSSSSCPVRVRRTPSRSSS